VKWGRRAKRGLGGRRMAVDAKETEYDPKEAYHADE
jgi:hypothetical protein